MKMIIKAKMIKFLRLTKKTTRGVFRTLSDTSDVTFYLLKVNNRNTKTMREICSKLTIKIPELTPIVIVNFEHVIAGWVAFSGQLFLLKAPSWISLI